MTTSGRRVKRRNLIEHDGTSSSRSKRTKWNNGRRTSKRKAQSLRPQRVSARNAINFSSQIAEASISEDEDDEDEEEDDGSEDNSSESESLLQDSNIQSNEPVGDLQNKNQNYLKSEKASLDESEDVVKPPKHLDSQTNVVNRKKLILKFSLRNPTKSVVSENSRTLCVNQANVTSSSSRPTEEPSKGNLIDLSLEDPMSSSANVIGVAMSESHINRSRDSEEFRMVEDHFEKSADYEDGKIRWGEVKIRSAKRMKSEDLMVKDSSTGFGETFDGHDGNRSDVKDDVKPSNNYGNSFHGSGIQNLGGNEAHSEEEEFGTGGLEDMDSARNKDFSPQEDADKLSNWSLTKGYKDCSESDAELKQNPKPKPTILRIKSKKSLVESKTLSKIKFITSGDRGDLVFESTSCREQNPVSGGAEVDEVPDRPSSRWGLHSDSNSRMNDSVHAWEKSCRSRVDSEYYGGVVGESSSKTRSHNHEPRTEFPEAATDATRRTRSLRLKAASRETNNVNHKFKENAGHISVGTSSRSEKSSKKAFDQPPSDQWTSTSTSTVRSRSARNRGDDYHNVQSGVSGKKLHYALRKSNWLLLTELEKSLRYIPQLGDEVVYLRQVSTLNFLVYNIQELPL